MFLFGLFLVFSHTAVDSVNCTFSRMHVTAAYESVGFLVVFPVYGLENVAVGEDQLQKIPTGILITLNSVNKIQGPYINIE